MFVFPYILILTLALASFLLKKLKFAAAVIAAIVAVLIFQGFGYAGLEVLGIFFALGVAATGWRKNDKAVFKAASDRGNRRDMWQVLANGGVAAICGLLLIIPAFSSQHNLFFTMMAGSFAAAMADTLSSELGMVYGRRFFNIISFKPDQKGLDGVVSLEGTLIGIAGAAVIGLIYCLNFGYSFSFWAIIIAGAVGNYVDSLLGATFERRHQINNNTVNCLNTLTGALIALAITLL